MTTNVYEMADELRYAIHAALPALREKYPEHSPMIGHYLGNFIRGLGIMVQAQDEYIDHIKDAEYDADEFIYHGGSGVPRDLAEMFHDEMGTTELALALHAEMKKLLE